MGRLLIFLVARPLLGETPSFPESAFVRDHTAPKVPVERTAADEGDLGVSQ